MLKYERIVRVCYAVWTTIVVLSMVSMLLAAGLFFVAREAK